MVNGEQLVEHREVGESDGDRDDARVGVGV